GHSRACLSRTACDPGEEPKILSCSPSLAVSFDSEANLRGWLGLRLGTRLSEYPDRTICAALGLSIAGSPAGENGRALLSWFATAAVGHGRRCRQSLCTAGLPSTTEEPSPG